MPQLYSNMPEKRKKIMIICYALNLVYSSSMHREVTLYTYMEGNYSNKIAHRGLAGAVGAFMQLILLGGLLIPLRKPP